MEVDPSSAARSGPAGASANSYIGSLISLTSKSEIRYEGILYNIDTVESSIGLRNVRSFGTEGRRKDGAQVPPSDKIYEYILFRGSDIKDLQVKASPPPPVQTTPSINSDPAIIQSHYPRPAAPPSNLPPAPAGTLGDLGAHSAQTGLPGSNFQSGLPLYQPGGNLNSWGPPPNTNNSGLAMPMYWQGFYGAPNGIPQLPQQPLLRPPPGLSIPPSLQHMQFSGFNTSLPMAVSSLPSSSLPDSQSSSFPISTSASSLTPTTVPAPSLSLNVPSLPPMSLPSSETTNLLPNKPLITTFPPSAPDSSLSSLSSLSTSTSAPDSVGIPPVASKSSSFPISMALPQQITSQPVSSGTVTSGAVVPESLTPQLITPGQLLQSGPSTAPTPAPAPAPQPSQTTQKDVEVDHVSPKPSVPLATEALPPILPLPPNTRAHKPNAGTYHMRTNYRGRGRRGPGMSRPMTQFTEDFDFSAMNEKFNKDEVWGHLGKNNRSISKDKEGHGSGSEEDAVDEEDDPELPQFESKPLYNKDDFFDSLSCNALDNDPNHGRTRYSEQMKLDTETFGDFSRYRGGRGGRGPYRGGGGRYRGSYHGRGNGGGYGSYHTGRGRGRGVHSRPAYEQ